MGVSESGDRVGRERVWDVFKRGRERESGRDKRGDKGGV